MNGVGVSGSSARLGRMTWQERAEAWRERCYEWRERYLEQTKRVLAIVDYCDQPGADIDGIKHILTGKDDPREET